MKSFFKIFIGIALVSILLGMGSYLIFIYYFTKEPEPITEYTFPNMSYEELEKRIGLEKIKKSKIDDSTYSMRYITLGKDSLNFFFDTEEDLKSIPKFSYKIKKYHGKAWINLNRIKNSDLKPLEISYDNRDDYPNELKLFEEGFINKLKK